MRRRRAPRNRRRQCERRRSSHVLRLAASTENPNHYLRIAVQYNALAEAEELSPSHGDGDWHFDTFDLTDGVLARPTSQGPGVFTFPEPFASMGLSASYPRTATPGT